MRLALIVSVIAVAAAGATAMHIAPSDDQRIDQLFALCSDLGRSDHARNCFNHPMFWRRSQAVAEQSGVRIIHAVMRRAQRYPASDESEMPWSVLLPLVAVLPRAEASKVLHRYEQSSDPAERLWAHEYLIEFRLSATPEDVKEPLGHK